MSTTSPFSRLTRHAAAVQDDLAAQDRAWAKGFTRRRFIQGAGMVGAAALGSQLVTTKAAFAAPAAGSGPATGNTTVVVFLRGGCDGLRVVVPASSSLGLDYLTSVRPALVPASSTLLPLSNGWAANAGLAPLQPFWASGELAFVPAVVTDPSRSHTTCARFLESGGTPVFSTGYLDRLLTVLGPGTTFRAVASGYTQPDSFRGVEEKLAVDSLSAFSMPGWGPDYAASAVASLYRGIGDAALTAKVSDTVAALGTAATARTQNVVQNGAAYPTNNGFANSLKDLAAMLRAEVGLQLATVDVGGWDTHTDEAADLDRNLLALSQCLAAFMTDLGPERRSRVTVVVMSEFGRRVAQNASGGTDHGFGGLMWLLGGGLASAQVAGRWNPLADATLDHGDVPGLNSPFDVLGELATARLGAGSLSSVFPGTSLSPLGLFRSS